MKILLFIAGKDIVGRAIKFFTGSRFAHVAIFLDGFTFESTVWQTSGSKEWMLWTYRSGVKITHGCKKADFYLTTSFKISSAAEHKMIQFALDQINDRWKYNVLLLLADMFIFKTRWFWDKIDWVPFSARYHGTVCSSFVDECLLAGGVNIFPGEEPATIVPGDYSSINNLISVDPPSKVVIGE